MKSINFLLVITALLIASGTGFSQSDSSASKAIQKTQKLDDELKSENPALALNESQKEQIIALHKEHMNEVSVFEKNNSNKDEIKAKAKELNKAMNERIKSEILTPEQENAQKAFRKKMKAEKGKKVGKTNKSSKKSAKKKKKSSALTASEADAIYATASAKQKAKAEKATEKLNKIITASDASLALSPDQVKQINALNIKSIIESAKMKKAGATKKEIKEVVKSKRRAINNILSKEQKNAQKKKK